MKKQIVLLCWSLIALGSQAQKSVVAAAKMNVVYIGVDNPMAIAAPSTAKVTADTGELTPLGDGRYNWTVTTPGRGAITVTLPDGTQETSEFRIKRIPDPVAQLGESSSGTMTVAEMQQQKGITALLANVDYDLQPDVHSYEMTWVRKGADPVSVENVGAAFGQNAKRLISQLQAGDVLYFDMVNVRMPDSPAPRKINSMVWKMK